MPDNWRVVFLSLSMSLAGTGCASSSKLAHNQVVDSRSSLIQATLERTRQSPSTRIMVDAPSSAGAARQGSDQRTPVGSQVASESAGQSQIRQVAHMFEVAPPESLEGQSEPTATEAPPNTTETEPPNVPEAQVSRSTEVLPIDLVTVIRLVNDNSPMVGFSRARVQEAQARADAAGVLWLPNLSVGTAYNRFDGQTQNQHGEVFSVSRSNLFANGGVSLSLDAAEANYRPLIEQRLASAEQQRSEATQLAAELDAIIAYLELAQVYGLIEINAQTLQKGEAMLVAARNAQRAKLDRTAGDVNRVQTEILLRRQERIDLEGKAGAASARLAKLLLLNPSVCLVPQKTELVPITLVNSEFTLDELVAMAIQNRPDLAASQEVLSAAWDRVHKAQRGPLLPKFLVQDLGGTFGGGLNSDLQNFAGRNSVSALMYWEVKNLGFGNRFEIQEREAGVDQAHFLVAETQSRMSAEVVEAAQISSAKFQSLKVAEDAVKEATELYRINQEGTFNLVDAKNLFDALRPLQALQVLNQARQNYLASVLDYTRSQYRLFTALGCPQGAVVNVP